MLIDNKYEAEWKSLHSSRQILVERSNLQTKASVSDSLYNEKLNEYIS